VEALIYLLSKGLAEAGHEITVFASAGSKPVAELVETLPGPYGTNGSPIDWQVCEWINLCKAVAKSERFDILHSHAYLWGLPLQSLSHAPIVHTLHVMPYENEDLLWALAPDSCITAISKYQWSSFPKRSPASVIYHGIDATEFTFQSKPEDYLCFIGRFIPEKGPLEAISIARALGMRLLLAGRPNDYFQKYIKPELDGRQVRFVGYVSGKDRSGLLGGAKALLYPIQAPEPFGLVLIEAMLCGTPVAAINLGAVPEIVDYGINGYYAGNLSDLTNLIPKTIQLDRKRVRAQAAQRFSMQQMIEGYLRVYVQLLERNIKH
jgi:glycosyltransferase involved in cell wall biosynthesis